MEELKRYYIEDFWGLDFNEKEVEEKNEEQVRATPQQINNENHLKKIVKQNQRIIRDKKELKTSILEMKKMISNINKWLLKRENSKNKNQMKTMIKKKKNKNKTNKEIKN